MASQTMMKILLNYTPELPCILFNSLYQEFFLLSKARIESRLRLITVVFRKHLNFLSHYQECHGSTMAK